MTSPKPTSQIVPQAIALTWTQSTDVQQILADEALVRGSADRVYLSFGQIQMPTDPTFGKNPEQVLEVVPVSRLVLTLTAFHKLVHTLNAVAAQLPKTDNTGAR
jgi:hypothetical protein